MDEKKSTSLDSMCHHKMVFDYASIQTLLQESITSGNAKFGMLGTRLVVTFNGTVLEYVNYFDASAMTWRAFIQYCIRYGVRLPYTVSPVIQPVQIPVVQLWYNPSDGWLGTFDECCAQIPGVNTARVIAPAVMQFVRPINCVPAWFNAIRDMIKPGGTIETYKQLCS